MTHAITIDRIANQNLSLPAKRILIIEDDFILSMMLETMLMQLGYEIAGMAPRLNEAIELVETQTFDAAILDVNINGQTTYELADRLTNKNIPFAFSTGYEQSSFPERYQNRPALQKPYGIDQLETLVESLLVAA